MRHAGRPATCCSFCGENAAEVEHLAKGRSSAMICDLCVAAAAQLMGLTAEQLDRPTHKPLERLP